ncbi:uncharacterized protein LOC131249561 [Magnolia sinica]|uniref:uncharacterized protein LOC131249561 n=1 Tax=Magnolia sinica TaxID=86752 RepID=UPI00265B5462|nr:uncharacterized protein LOC131249561 [Magnolia sinica]
MVHKLNIDPHHQPVRQKRRAFELERYAIIGEEVGKLLEAGFIKEIYYLDWIANVILVKKSNRKWWVCVNYTDMNKACPTDSFLLPRIDQLVNNTAGHELLSFMDAYSGYNQIAMHPYDKQKMTFVTDKGLYYYKVYTIIVPTNQPLHQVLQKPEVSGRLTKWAIELGKFDVKYQPQSAIKGQVVVDFIVELTCRNDMETSLSSKTD